MEYTLQLALALFIFATMWTRISSNVKNDIEIFTIIIVVSGISLTINVIIQTINECGSIISRVF